MDDLLKIIEKEWSWAIGRPAEIIATNSFGNTIVRTEKGDYFRIVPEDLRFVHLTDSADGLERIRNDADFRHDWEMKVLVERAEKALGKLGEGQCYCLVIPSVLGGAYELSNIKMIPIKECLGLSGSLAKQIKDLPDGTQVKLKFE